MTPRPEVSKITVPAAAGNTRFASALSPCLMLMAVTIANNTAVMIAEINITQKYSAIGADMPATRQINGRSAALCNAINKTTQGRVVRCRPAIAKTTAVSNQLPIQIGVESAEATDSKPLESSYFHRAAAEWNLSANACRPGKIRSCQVGSMRVSPSQQSSRSANSFPGGTAQFRAMQGRSLDQGTALLQILSHGFDSTGS
jgi:hypothetical protein